MGFLSGIGNIFHAIGGFFEGGDDNQPQQQHPNNNFRAAPPTQMPSAVFAPQPARQNTPAPTPAPAPNTVSLPQAPQKAPQVFRPAPNPNSGANNFNIQDLTNGTLAKAQPTAPTVAPNGLDRAITTGADIVARSAIGVPQGISQLVDQLTPGKGTNRFTKSMNQAGAEVDRDQAKNGINATVRVDGEPVNLGDAIYKGGQIGLNVGTGLEGGINAVKSIPKLVKAAPDIIKGIPDAVQGVGDIADKVIGKVSPVNLLNKANTATDIAAPVENTAKAADELAVGVKSANPNQAEDALNQIAQKQAEASATNPNASAPVQPTAPVQSTGQPVEGTAPVLQTSPTQTTIPPVQNGLPAEQIPSTPAMSPVEKLETPENPASQTPSSNNVPQTQTPVNPQTDHTALNAPNVRTQAQKDLDTASHGIDIGTAKAHDVLSNKQLNEAAGQFVNSMSDKELVDYAHSADAVGVRNAGDISKAYVTVKRLNQLAVAGDKEAAAAIPRILDAVEQATSEGGRNLNYVGSMLEDAPQQVRKDYVMKNINRYRSTHSLPPLSDEEAANISAKIDENLSAIEAKKNDIASAQQDLDKIKANPSNEDQSAQVNAAQKTIDDSQHEVKQLNTQIAKQYAQAAGVKGNWAKSMGDTARAAMLTNPFGRLSDIATTGINAADKLVQMGGEALLGKAKNVIGGTPGKYIDTFPVKSLWQGTKAGTKTLADDYKGNIETSDLYSAIKGGARGGKANMPVPVTGTPGTRLIKNTGHAMAETATNLSQGLGNFRVQQLALQAGKQAGLTGRQLSNFASATAASPSSEMAQKGQQLVFEINNMNDNPWADLMHHLSSAFTDSKVGRAMDNSTGGKIMQAVGEQIRNITAPFTKWAATAAYNGVTDKNVIANVAKMAGQLSIKDGQLTVKDPQELVSQISNFGKNATVGFGTGYMMAQHGLLTTHNAEGYNDEGLYLHMGGHYIPVTGFLGFLAPSILMGWATHQALNDNRPGSVMSKITNATGNMLLAGAKGYLGNTMIGGNSEVVKQTQAALNGTGNTATKATDALATAGTDAVRTLIPGAVKAINPVMNSLGILNPTHEAGLTRVNSQANGGTTGTGSPSPAKDIPRSDVMSVLNDLPGIGQKFVSRNPGVAAPDVLSAITRGDNASSEQAATNKAVDTLPPDKQQAAFTQLRKSDSTAIAQQQQAVKGATGPAKAQSQQALDKLQFEHDAQSPADVVNTIKQQQQTDAAKQQLMKSGSGVQTTGGKSYAIIGGQAKPFDTPLKAQQALDQEAFTKSNKDIAYNVNGKVYQRGSDGKVTAMDTKDYDYQKASDGMKLAKTKDDLPGYISSAHDLLGNIGWQIKHAGLTDHQRSALTDRAQTIVDDLAKYQSYGGFTKGKSGSSSAVNLVKSNTVGNLPTLARENFMNNLTAKSVSARIPQIALTSPDSLIKKHAISVSTPKGNYN